MKKILLLSALTAALFTTASVQNRAAAQVRINVQIGQPQYYDPRGAYAVDDDYYYMPEYNAYYSPVRRMYYYNEGGRWMYYNRLPQRYGNVAYGRGNWQRVRGRSPWMGRSNNGYRADNGYRHDNGNHNGWRNNGDRSYNYNRPQANGGNGNTGYHNGQNNGGYQNNNNNNAYQNGNGNNGGGYRGRH